MKRVEKESMKSEYNFSKGIRGKYHNKLRSGVSLTVISGKSKLKQNLVFLDPDVAKVFSDSKSVNTALRHILDAVPKKAL